jgi:acyl-CoA hydrolase
MEFNSRKLIKPADLNPRETLFGGQLLAWIDEEAAIFVTEYLETPLIVTKYIDEIDFVAPAFKGDIIEIGIELVSVGNTSVTVKCVVRNLTTKNNIIEVNKLTFVRIGADGHSKPHGKDQFQTRDIL